MQQFHKFITWLYFYPFSVHVVTFNFITLLLNDWKHSQFTFKTTHVKNVCDASLKISSNSSDK
jgi:hypothetical protein